MRSCLILGSGRSGTSMVTGSLARSGYFMGAGLHPARAANPRGFFEDASVNNLNDALIAQVRPRMGGGHGWLQRLDLHEPMPRPTPQQTTQMQSLVAQPPYCFKDPRFSYTLDAWRPHLAPDVGLLCVFRHPLLTARSIAEECRRAAYLSTISVSEDDALAIWAAMYRHILRRHRAAGPQPWLFVHYDQMLDGTGQHAMEHFLGAPIDAAFPDKTLRRPPPAGDLPAEVADLYQELCALAGHQPATTTTIHSAATAAATTAPDVSIIAVVGPDDAARLPQLRAEAQRQRGVSVELVVVDFTDAGDLPPAEAGEVRVRVTAPSRGDALLAGLAASTGRHVAWADGRCWRMPNQLARAVAVLDGRPPVALVLSDMHLSDDGDRFLRTVSLRQAEVMPVGWRGGVVLRREALAGVDRTAFWPAELALLRRLQAAGQVHMLAEPLFSVDAEAFVQQRDEAVADTVAVGAAQAAWDDAPLLTVSLCTYSRAATLRACLEQLCRQTVPVGAFAITIVNDGSTDGTRAMLDSVSGWPVPVTVLHRDNGGLAAARNTGLAQTHTPLVLFINDDTMAAPDLIQQHILGHQTHPDSAILGSFPQPPAELRRALTRAVETGGLMFCYDRLSTEQPNPPSFFYTCNVSAPTAHVQAAGGFDERFRHYGAEDTDLGLRLGLPVHYIPAAAATHRHPYDFAYVQRRARMVARAHVRLWAKHPDIASHLSVRTDGAQRTLASNAKKIAHLEASAAALAGVDLEALQAAGQGALAEQILSTLSRQLQTLNPIWWLEGVAAGLKEHGQESMVGLLAEAHPLELPEVRRTVWLLAPTRDAAEVWAGRVVQFGQSFRGNDPVTLLLLAGIDGGYSTEELANALSDFEEADRPHVAIVQTGLPPEHDVRLLASADGWIPTGSAQDARLRSLAAVAGCPEVEPRPDQAAWPLNASNPTRLLAWPRWSSEDDLRTLMSDYALPLCGTAGVTLCLRLDPAQDGAVEGNLARLERIAGEILPPDGGALDVLVVEDPIRDEDLPRLGRAVDRLLALPSNGSGEVLGARLGVPVLHSTAELRAHLHA